MKRLSFLSFGSRRRGVVKRFIVALSTRARRGSFRDRWSLPLNHSPGPKSGAEPKGNAMRQFAAILAVLAIAGITHAQETKITFDPTVGRPQLTEAGYQQIISRKGFNKKCLHLSDAGRGFLGAIARAGGEVNTHGTGFSIDVCTAANWIARRFGEAAKVYKPLSWADLTEDDKDSSVLRIIGYPDETTTLNLKDGQNVEHIVLRHHGKKERKTLIAQPLRIELLSWNDINNLGGEREWIGMVAFFSVEDLEIVRDKKKGEFLVTVAAANEKNFKIKTKHFDDLGWPKKK